MYHEINFDNYLRAKQTNALELTLNPLYISIFMAFTRAFENGWIGSPFERVLREIEAKAQHGRNVFINGYKVNFESFQQSRYFSAKRFKIEGIHDVAFLHFVRNILINPEITYDDILARPDDFECLPDYMNEFHKKNTAEYSGNESNVKWVSKDGLREYIFREGDHGWERVRDPINQGSYNYIPPSDMLGHTEIDVMPWTFFGNFITDPTKENDRLPAKLTEYVEPTDFQSIYTMIMVLSCFRSFAN